MARNEGIHTMVRRMSPTRYTVKEAAGLVGKSPDTLTRWRKTGTYEPSESIKAGSLTVWLYTDDDIDRMRRLAKTMKPGRKPS